MPDYALIQGNALHLPLANESVHTVATSPPYWGLRDYGVPGQLGLEETPREFVAQMVAVFEEVRRVLRPEGVAWLNIADSYATGAGKVGDCPGGGEQGERWAGYRGTREGSPKHAQGAMGPMTQPNRLPLPGLKPKDLCLTPFRLVLALQEAGWWVRSVVIWSKPNPLPESVTDRPTTSHEYLFMLTKAACYYYDQEAVREGAKYGRRVHESINGKEKYHLEGAPENPHTLYFKKTKGADPSTGRNLRSVWRIPTQPMSARTFGIHDTDHFASFPEALVEPCILAGPGEVCAACGAPRERITQPSAEYAQHFGSNNGADADRGGKGYRKHSPAISADYRTVGWRPTCRCGCEQTRPATILDPFCGSGTVGVVALRHGRRFVGVDLNAKYLALARARIEDSLTEPEARAAIRAAHRNGQDPVRQMRLF